MKLNGRGCCDCTSQIKSVGKAAAGVGNPVHFDKLQNSFRPPAASISSVIVGMYFSFSWGSCIGKSKSGDHSAAFTYSALSG